MADTHKDVMGQRVEVGDKVCASFMHGRHHNFIVTEVLAKTSQFAVVRWGKDERKVRFYNLVVVRKSPKPSAEILPWPL